MIVSYEHKYLFVEIPLTASWAIRQQLCDHYAGIPILHKHASYPEFRRSSVVDKGSYFVFATVRNPLDKLVSRYYKLKTDFKGAFSDQESTRSLLTDYSDHRRYEYIRASDATFEEYFRKYCRRHYSDQVDISSSSYDFVIRYEALQEDFTKVLRLLKIRQIGTLPIVNRTPGRRMEWEAYYTPDLIKQAKDVCGPFMRKWGYEFPSDWGDYRASWYSQARYNLFCLLQEVYVTRFRYSQSASAMLVRRLRAQLIRK